MLRRRSFPIDSIAKLFSVDVEFHSLQKETSEHDLKFLSQYNTIVQHQDALTDFLETAALINEMDLVISIDTSVAHLAGALGKPLWVLLPYYTDYRWTADAETTPWYPSARLFRQARPGDFAGVMDQVVQCLKGYRF